MKKILTLLATLSIALTILTACADNTIQPTDGQVVNAGNTVSNPAVTTDENKTEATPPAEEKPTEDKKTEEIKTEAPTNKVESKTKAPTVKPGNETETQKKTEPVKKTEAKTTVTTTKAAPEVKTTKEEAKKAVLKHAGLNENEISRYKIELDREKAGIVYEIEFDAGKYEYEYEVNAENGKIIKSEKEIRD